MFHIIMKFEDINIASIEKEELGSIYKWYVKERKVQEEGYKRYITNKDEFYESFLEYYLSECEFFLKIEKRGILVGTIRGRFEFKNPNMVWIYYISLKPLFRGKGLGTKILNNLLKYFNEEYDISNFYTKIKNDDYGAIRFMKKNKFNDINYVMQSGRNKRNIDMIFSKTYRNVNLLLADI